jgi:hypothetical protein
MKEEFPTLTEVAQGYKDFIGIDKRESLINFRDQIKGAKPQRVQLNPNNHGFKCLKKYDRAKTRELIVMAVNEETGMIRCSDLWDGGILYYHYQHLLIID